MTRTVRHWTTGEVRRLADLRAAGLTVAACAAALDRTPRSVAWALQSHGLTRPVPPWKRSAGMLRRLVRRLRNKGKGGAEIADALGVSRSAVYAALARGKTK